MTVIHVREFDWYYANEHIGKSVILHADGYSIEGYDMDKYTIDRAVKEYTEKNQIKDEIKLEGTYDGKQN